MTKTMANNLEDFVPGVRYNGLKTAGKAQLLSDSSATAGGAVVYYIGTGTTGVLGTYFGSGAPTISAGKGSLYLRTDGTGTTNRMYVNTDGSTTWTNVTTAA